MGVENHRFKYWGTACVPGLNSQIEEDVASELWGRYYRKVKKKLVVREAKDAQGQPIPFVGTTMKILVWELVGEDQ